MRITQPNQLKIGQWWTMCCERALKQIETVDEVQDIIELWDDTGVNSASVWNSFEDATTSILSGYKSGEDRFEALEVIKLNYPVRSKIFNITKTFREVNI